MVKGIMERMDELKAYKAELEEMGDNADEMAYDAILENLDELERELHKIEGCPAFMLQVGDKVEINDHVFELTFIDKETEVGSVFIETNVGGAWYPANFKFKLVF